MDENSSQATKEKTDMVDNTPIYNLKAVIKETGLSPATLRAWERRYGLIKPQRSPGGHRLYSRQDIELLKWLIARQKEGLSISSAAEMWKDRSGIGGSEPALNLIAPERSESGVTILDKLRDQWVLACTKFDDASADQVLDQAFAIASPEIVCVDLLQQGMAEVGKGWYGGTVTVQQEHFASAIAKRRLDVLLEATPAPARPQTILVACPPEEEHDFILLLVTYLLRRSGWKVIYLGSDVPIENLDDTVKSTHPSLVISAAQTLIGAAALSEMSQYLITQGIQLAFGGWVFMLIPDLRKRISGFYLGKNLAALAGIVEVLVVAPPALSNPEPASSEYSHTLESFNRSESAILAQVDSTMNKLLIDTNHVFLANKHLTQFIQSALKLGDITLMDHAIEWLDGLLNHRGLSQAISKRYYAAYQQALEDHLGKDAELILEWFQKLV